MHNKIDDELVYDKAEHGPLLSPPEASKYLLEEHHIKRSPARLADMRCVGSGPWFLKQTRLVFYPKNLLDAWAAEVNGRRLRRSTEFKSVAEAAA
jgi:hypothetical protein